jgi:hypothetical protein
MHMSSGNRSWSETDWRGIALPPVTVRIWFALALASIAIGAAVVAYGLPARTPTQGAPHRPWASAAGRDGVATATGHNAAGFTVLWRADMEEGSLADWYFPEISQDAPNIGGGEFDSDNGVASATQEQAHTGRWSARLALPEGAGGSRLFRWRETRAFREVLVTVWLYFPRTYRVNGQYWNVLQFKSRSATGENDPLWFLDVANTEAGGMRFNLVWWHRTLEGPHAGESGFRRLQQNMSDIPVARWFEMQIWLRESHDFTGQLRVWQDGRLLFDMDHVRTSYENCAISAWCTSNEFAVNNYSDGLSPSPVFIYADDAEIAVPDASGSAVPQAVNSKDHRNRRSR